MQRRRRRLLSRRKKFIDADILIDYKRPDILKRFVTDRGKIIPGRVSGATASQQRKLTKAIKRARFMALLPYTVAHRTERGFAGEMTASAAAAGVSDR